MDAAGDAMGRLVKGPGGAPARVMQVLEALREAVEVTLDTVRGVWEARAPGGGFCMGPRRTWRLLEVSATAVVAVVQAAAGACDVWWGPLPDVTMQIHVAGQVLDTWVAECR